MSGGAGTIPPGVSVRASHVLIKHEESRNPVSRRTNKSTADLSKADAEKEMDNWIAALEKGERPCVHFAARAKTP